MELRICQAWLCTEPLREKNLSDEIYELKMSGCCLARACAFSEHVTFSIIKATMHAPQLCTCRGLPMYMLLAHVGLLRMAARRAFDDNSNIIATGCNTFLGKSPPPHTHPSVSGPYLPPTAQLAPSTLMYLFDVYENYKVFVTPLLSETWRIWLHKSFPSKRLYK